MTDMEPSTPKIKPRLSVFLALVVVCVIILVGLLLFIGLWLKKSHDTSMVIGQPIPDFSITAYGSGVAYRKSDLAGKLILVNFWSSWCLSCEDEGKDLETVWREVKDSGDILFLGVNYVDTETEALAFLEDLGITYPNGPDLGSRISRIFKIQAVPESYLIGKDGNLAAIQIGTFLSADEVRLFIEKGE